MLTELSKLGEVVRQLHPDYPVRFVTENEVYRVLCIKLRKQGDTYSYEGISIEDYSVNETAPNRYNYIKGASNGANLTIASMITFAKTPASTVTSAKRTLNKKIFRWFKSHKGEKDLKPFHESLELNKKSILDELTEKVEELVKKRKSDKIKGNMLLDLKVETDGGVLYPLDIGIFRDLLEKDLRDSYRGKSEGHGTCYVCGGKKEVYGNVLPTLGLKFATSDKPGFAPELSGEQFWKSAPVCRDCARNIEWGYSYIINHFDFPSPRKSATGPNPDGNLGFRFMMIPKSIKVEPLEEICKRAEANTGEGSTGIVTSEDNLMEAHREMKDNMPMWTMLFYRKINSSFEILRRVDDVLPSRIWEIAECHKQIEGNQGSGELWFMSEPAMKSIVGKKFVGKFIGGGIGSNKVVFQKNWFVTFLREFYSKRVKTDTGTNTVLDGKFFDIIDAMFTEDRVDFDVIPDFIRRIRGEWAKNVSNARITVLKSLVILRFFDILSAKVGGKNMGFFGKDGVPSSVEEFLDMTGINDAEKRASLAVGVLVSKVLYVQRKEREVRKGKEPFLAKLNDFVVDHDRLRTITTESVAKLRQYRYSYNDEEKAAFDYLIRTENMRSLNRDSISYYFTVGIVLGDAIWPKRDGKSQPGSSGSDIIE